MPTPSTSLCQTMSLLVVVFLYFQSFEGDKTTTELSHTGLDIIVYRAVFRIFVWGGVLDILTSSYR